MMDDISPMTYNDRTNIPTNTQLPTVREISAHTYSHMSSVQFCWIGVFYHILSERQLLLSFCGNSVIEVNSKSLKL